MSAPIKYWRSPVERLMTGGEHAVHRAIIGFASEYSVPLIGQCIDDDVDAEDRERLAGLGLEFIEDDGSQTHRKVREHNLAIANGIVVLGRTPAELRFLGTPMFRVIPWGEGWEPEFTSFLLGAAPANLLFVEHPQPFEDPVLRESFVWELLRAVFRAGESRDPADTVIPGDEAVRRFQAIQDWYPGQFEASLDLEVEPGWLSIVEDLCAGVDLALSDPQLRVRFSWTQIKEKFGSLRAYYQGGPLRIDLSDASSVASLSVPSVKDYKDVRERTDRLVQPLIQAAAEQCERTCALCGEPGVLRKRLYRRTLCDLHALPGWFPHLSHS